MLDEERFREWILELDEAVIQGEFGYERGEFNVFPDVWRPLFEEGLSPREAWQHAMDAHKEAREQEERLRQENWERMQAEPLFCHRQASLNALRECASLLVDLGLDRIIRWRRAHTLRLLAAVAVRHPRPCRHTAYSSCATPDESPGRAKQE